MNALVPVGSLTAALALKDANVTDEINRSGASFGNLILTAGKAVAETQKRLNETGADTATELANALVDVIAVQEKVYTDLGNVTQTNTHVQHLPLVNFIDPVFYQWSQVRLQGVFYAGEFATDGTTTSVSGTFDTKANINLIGVSGIAKGTVNASQVKNDSNSDISYGDVRLNALLEPRSDITVPKPTQVIQGPRLAIIHGSITDIKTSNVLTARTLDIVIQYHKRDGTPIAGKAISIEAPGVAWSFTGGLVTDSNGNLQVQLRREFLDVDADTTAKDFVVSARIGILQNNSTVNF
ncbi:MAG TPA: hypothetical protein VLL54_13605 [Pyrinomonadaceae bacterium]|nr:hypothetical protein [Pyrinomonadaceae bacterium]